MKKNGFWIAMGVLAFGAIVAYLVLVVFGTNPAIAKAKKQLEGAVRQLEGYAGIEDEKVASPTEGMPVPKIAQYWAKRGELTRAELEEILKRYRARDKRFEEIIGGQAEVSSFVPRLRTEYTKLREQYAAMLPEGQADKVFAFEELNEGDEGKIPQAQKQLNVTRAIAEAAKEAGVAKIVSITFAPSGSGGGDGAGRAASAKELERIPVEVELRMPFQGLAKLVSKLLKSQVVFEVAGAHVQPEPFSVEQYIPFKLFQQPTAGGQPGVLKTFSEEVYIATGDPANEITRKGAPPVAEPPVGVKLALNVLDFDLPEKKANAKEEGK